MPKTGQFLSAPLRTLVRTITSQRCSSCGHTEAANRPSQAGFCCRACGFKDHAYVNAARNILWLGLSLRCQKREAETGAA
jgi:transposase